MGTIELVALFVFAAIPAVAVFIIVAPVFREANEELRKSEIELRRHEEEMRKFEIALRKWDEMFKDRK